MIAVARTHIEAQAAPKTVEAQVLGDPTEAAAAQKDVAPYGYVRGPAGCHPRAYGLVMDEGGAGLLAPPGSTVMVEPVAPTGAGLAVLYIKGKPEVWDLTHNFVPGSFDRIPGSTGPDTVEVVEPQTGRRGRAKVEAIEKAHNVIGVYTPEEVRRANRLVPAALPVYRTCPEGMGEHTVDNASAYPLVREGETVIFDPSQRDLATGQLCVIEWNNGRRSVLLTDYRKPGSNDQPAWWVDPVNRPSSTAMMERLLKSKRMGVLFASDGPYDAEYLRSKIVGRVVAILVPDRRDDEGGCDRPRTVIETATAAARAAAADAGLTSEVSEEVLAAIENHRDVVASARAEVDDSDEAFHAHAAREGAADKALQEAPVRSLADLRAKLLYLAPQIIPDIAGSAEADHLEAICADMDRLCCERSRPAENHEDAELLRLGEEFDRAHAVWRRAAWANKEPQQRLAAYIRAAKLRGGFSVEDVKAAWDLPGVTAANEAEDDAFNNVAVLSNRIWAVSHRTPAGLAVKARALIGDYFGRCNYEEDAALGDDEDLHHQRVRWLIEACCTLAGVDWRGDPIAPPIPDPIFAAIDRHLAARLACVGLDDAEDEDKYEAAHDRRREALDAVEAMQPTTVTGLLAMARHMNAYLTEDGEPPQDSASAQEQAFLGLIKACLGLHAARYPGMDRDWAQAAAYHPGFLPSPQHQPAGLLCLTSAIPLEAARLYDLAEAEFERRRQAYVGFHDPTVWPRVAADLRRDMRMDALAQVARHCPRRSPSAAAGADPILAAIERHAAARVALDAASRAQDEVAVAERGGDTSAEAMAPARAVYEAADQEEKAAWADLFNERPTTLPGVQMLLWHAGRWASENDGLSGVLNVTEVFEHIGDGLAGVIGSAAEELRRATAADAERKAFAVAAADMLDHELVTEIWARAREMQSEAFAGVRP